MSDDRPGLTIIARCSAGLRLVSDRPKGWEWESFPRRTQGPRYRQRGLAPWRGAKDGVHIPAAAEVPDGKES